MSITELKDLLECYYARKMYKWLICQQYGFVRKSDETLDDLQQILNVIFVLKNAEFCEIKYVLKYIEKFIASLDRDCLEDECDNIIIEI